MHENGSIPVIIHPSEKAVVEVVYQLVPSEQACRSALEAYHKRLVVEQGDRIRHRLSCVNIADGKVTNATTIAATF